jgi:hypothetical protein
LACALDLGDDPAGRTSLGPKVEHDVGHGIASTPPLPFRLDPDEGRFLQTRRECRSGLSLYVLSFHDITNFQQTLKRFYLVKPLCQGIFTTYGTFSKR